MHPNVFLKTFWRMEFKPQIFVAMSFSPKFDARYKTVIAPAIEGIIVNQVPLKAYRVDASKSGDSILTDIMDGIAHSEMVLADVSSAGIDSVTGQPYRNGNVMYEVGIALACRQSEEVLLIRDDNDRFLFDVSTIPHMKIDFGRTEEAQNRLREELIARLKERNYVNDARVQLATAGLCEAEFNYLKGRADDPSGTISGRSGTSPPNLFEITFIPRLLDKGLISFMGKFSEGGAGYLLTPLGAVVAKLAKNVPEFKPAVPTSEGDDVNEGRKP